MRDMPIKVVIHEEIETTIEPCSEDRQTITEVYKRIYTPVSLDCFTTKIRVLLLYPGRHDEALRGQLVVTSPDDVVKYEALSYTWGRSTDGVPITLNGVDGLMITPNLASALQRLRLTDHCRRLWVDALCIDQSNVKERSKQVTLMGRIYNCADDVLIWLGDAQVHEQHHEYPPSTLLYKHLEPITICESDMWALHDAIHSTEPSWWDRAWTMQEFALARKLPTICFATAALSINQVETLAFVLQKEHSCKLAAELLETLWKLQNGIGKLGSSHWKRSLPNLACFTFNAEATDQRDKIYSLLSMMNFDESSHVKPDYSKTSVQVFVDATLAAITARQRLNILGLVSPTRSRKMGLPSWVVDFSFSRSQPPYPEGIDRFYSSSAGEAGWVRYCNGVMHNREEQLPAQYRLLDCGSILEVTGRAITIIDDSVEMPSSREMPTNAYMRSRISHMISKLSRSDPYAALYTDSRNDNIVSSTDVETAHSWTLFINSAKTEAAASDLFMQMIQAWSKCTGYQESLTRMTEPILMEPLHQNEREKTFLPMRISDWFRYSRYAGSSPIFLTCASNFIGMAPDTVEPGDQVTLLRGCKFPAMLRPGNDGSFSFRGFAWIHGLMHGEFWEQCNWQEFHERTFTLF